jgi:hypothetical protein
MSILAIIGLAVVIFVVFAALRPVDPASKTNDQLRYLYGRSLNAGSAGSRDRAALEDEMRRRGLLGDSSRSATASEPQSHLDQLKANILRQDALSAYDEGWTMAQDKWSNDPIKRHRHALTNVLLRRIQKEADAPPVTTELIETLNFEAIPFGNLPQKEGKDSIAEYMVWREFPSLANGTPIEFAIEQLKAKGFMTDVLKDNGVESIAWVPWSRLL